MPDLSHLWQRFMLASALVFGLLLGVVATVFGYSNTSSVGISWSVLHVTAVPLWTVAVVPLVVVLVAGTVYHWVNSFHHFTEHMRHRHRVHELEAEVVRLRGHLDHVLDMPDGSTSQGAVAAVETAPVAGLEHGTSSLPAPAPPEVAASNGAGKSTRRPAQRKKVTLETETGAERGAVAAGERPTGEISAEPAKPAAAATASTPATADL